MYKELMTKISMKVLGRPDHVTMVTEPRVPKLVTKSILFKWVLTTITPKVLNLKKEVGIGCLGSTLRKSILLKQILTKTIVKFPAT